MSLVSVSDTEVLETLIVSADPGVEEKFDSITVLAAVRGGGGGGSMVALCPDSSERVRNAMQAAGYKTLSVTLD